MEYKYKAFISYRREGSDESAAEKLQQMLERYIVPKDYRKNNQKKLGYIFRDRTHIDADPKLRKIIYDTLDSSEYLIVMCSGKIMDKNHPWVMDEIGYFLEKHPDSRDKILTVLVEDEPEKAIPEILYTEEMAPDGTVKRVLPNYVDIRGDHKRKILKNLSREFFRIAGTLLSCSPDALAMRDKIRRRTKTAFWIGGVAAVLAVITGILMWSNWQIEGKNQELDQKNEELKQQNNEILLNTAQEYLSYGDRASAIRTVLQIFTNSSSVFEYNAPAEELLIRALGLFDEGGPEPLILKTILEHVNPISDFCISDDGSKVFIVDINSLVMCFDIRTGAILWEYYDLQKIMTAPELGYSSPYQPSIRIGDKSIHLVGDKLIIHDYKTTIAALSQQTGQIHWLHEAGFDSWGQICHSADMKTIAYVDHRHSICCKTLNAVFLDTATGKIQQEIPVCNWLSDQDWEVNSITSRGQFAGLDPTGALSVDGMLFAGCYLTEGANGVDNLCYYLADRRTDECRVISRQEVSLSPECFGVKVHFTDDGETLTFIRAEGDDDYGLTIEKYDLSGNCLWKQTTPSDLEKDFRYIYRIPCLFSRERILLVCQDQIYLLNSITGEFLSDIQLDAPVLDLYPAGEESFAVLLENGEYRIGWFSEDVFSQTAFLCTLSATEKLDSCAFIPDVSTHPLNGGTVAIVPQENAYCVELTKLVPLDGSYKNIYTGVNTHDLFLTDSYHIFPDENTILIGEAYVLNGEIKTNIPIEDTLYADRYALIDTRTNQLREYIGAPWVNFGTCWLQNGACYVKYDRVGNIALVTPTADNTSKYCILSKSSDADATGKEENVNTGHISDLVLRSVDQTAIAILCRDEDIAYFQIQGIENGKVKGTMTTFLYPDEITTGVIYCVILGANNYLGILYTQEGDELYTNCQLRDLETMNSILLSTGEGESFHEIWFAEQHPLCAVLYSSDIMRVLDMTTGEFLCSIPFVVPYSSITAAQFIMEDQYLLVHTIAGQIDIYDCSTGEIVYSEWGSNLYSVENLHYVEDPENHRLYIQKSHHVGTLEPGGYSASCIDTRTWIKIAEIPGFVTIDIRSNTIYRLVTIGEEECLYACSLPTTEELLGLGKKLLDK